jgi:TM2 domain-containing membrane protein YozV
MKGNILDYSEARACGVISGDDEVRYSFAKADWKGSASPLVGQRADFVAEGSSAREIYPLASDNPIAALFQPGQKNRILAAVFAICLGTFGIHKFYLGRNMAGIIMLVLGLVGWCVFALGSMISILGIVEGVLYLVRTDEEFDRIYVKGEREWL